MEPLALDVLKEGLTGQAAAVRCKVPLKPAGGPQDKVFPPTYGVPDSAQTKYALESRRIGGGIVDCVLLDSVASQANRMELALLDAAEAGDLTLPMVGTDFNGVAGLDGLGFVTALQTPHRIYDALLRDSLHDDLLFRLSDVGRAVTEASTADASALFRYCPTALVFGAWDSTGPKGGKGNKFERALTSEIVGIGVAQGVKVSSRIDPAGIELRAAKNAYRSVDADEMWTDDEAEAAKDEKGKLVGIKPSEMNHGNVTPSIDTKSGGVTIDRAEQVSVLSFAALRRLRFRTDGAGTPLSDRPRAEAAARVALASLAVAAVSLAYEADYDLRSRCVLVPQSPLTFEVLSRGADEVQQYALDATDALTLVKTAADEAAEAGLGWETTPIRLQPTQRLVNLILKSRQVGEEQEDSD